MSRMSSPRYRRQLTTAMFLYVGAMLLVLPASRHATLLPWKVLLALVPVLPMLYVIGLIAQRIRASDEFEQRTHLVALGAATALIGGLSLVGGFLAAAGVPGIDGTLLIWVFPVLMAAYASVRWWLITRYYGGTMECDDAGFPFRQRMLLVGTLVALVLLAAWWRGELSDFDAGLMAGMLGAIGLVLVARLVARLLRRRDLQRNGD